MKISLEMLLMIDCVVCHQLQIEVVELDGAVADVAKSWFGFIEDQRMKVFVEDGLKFIHNAEGEFFLKAYSIGSLCLGFVLTSSLTFIRLSRF